MLTSDTCELLKYILNGHSLSTRETAQHIWDTERLDQRSYLCINFTGVIAEELSIEFINELFRLDCPEDHLDLRLIPINCSSDVAVLLGGCFFRSRKRRELNPLDNFVKAELIMKRRGG